MTPTTLRDQFPLARERQGDLAHRKHETTLGTSQPHLGYIRPACSCGWAGDERDPYEPRAYAAARDDAARHHRDVAQARRNQLQGMTP